MEFTLTLMLVVINIGIVVANESCEEENIHFNETQVTQRDCFCKENICFQKCCPFGKVLDLKLYIDVTIEDKTIACVDATERFNASVYDEYNRLIHKNAVDVFYFKVDFVYCSDEEYILALASYYKGDFHLKTNGHLYIDSPISIPPWMAVSPDNYCIDNFMDPTDRNIRVNAMMCISQSKKVPSHYILTSTCLLVSCVFILLTVGVYIWLPKLHNVHGRVLIAYLTCLFVGFLCMAIMQLLLYYDKGTAQVCETMTFVIYFSFLCAFFWLNVMCYDIWRVFSGNRELRNTKLMVWSQIRAYAIYALGVPTILTILLVVLEYSDLPNHPLLPMIRLQGCFLKGNGKLLYLYGPITIVCVANMVLFVLTAMKIWRARKETSMLNSQETSRHDLQDNKQTLFLYVKLFILMGLSWILEVVSALYPEGNWIYTDTYNLLTGFLIFIIFVCKRQIFTLLKERYNEGKTKFPTHSTSIRTASS